MPKGIWVADDEGSPREEFLTGQTVFLGAHRLRAHTLFTFSLLHNSSGGGVEVVALDTTDRHGSIPLTPLLPRIGILSLAKGRLPKLYESAEEDIGGRRLTLRATLGGREGLSEHQLRLVRTRHDEPLGYPAGPDGLPVSGVELGRCASDDARTVVRYPGSQQRVLRQPFSRRRIRPLPKEC